MTSRLSGSKSGFSALISFLISNFNFGNWELSKLIFDLICGHEIVGSIGLRPAGVLNEKEDYTTFFIGKKRIDIPEEELETFIVYKGKTIRELLEEDIIYNIVVY